MWVFCQVKKCRALREHWPEVGRGGHLLSLIIPFFHPLYSFHIYVLSVCYVSGTMEGAGRQIGNCNTVG